MKELWVKADGNSPWDERKKLVTTALESGADAVIVNKGEVKKVKELGRIRVIADDDGADFRLVTNLADVKKGTVFYKEINNKDDEQEIVKAGKKADYVVLNAKNWKVIPLENIIAGLQKENAKIIVEVANAAEAKTALETLEVGADGVLVNAGFNEIKKIKKLVDELSEEKITLTAAKITGIKSLGMGDRVCVDTCSVFGKGEGMLVGSQSNGMFLVHSETIETPYVATRPFRVNAGAVHAYVRVPEGKTKYLSELDSGDDVLAVDSKGKTRRLIVGRAKIEKRPLMLVEAEVNGKKIKTLLQNAETIRLVDKNGKAISVVELKKGDEVLVYVEEKGRHFGMAVDESIAEK
ncbi:MAG: 3-dehydroquinate synthase [Candidatus Altiarchaeales archaeon IMC4]|nr:MAG: 3-dehydroquinate synthase [Candidatus Altiarchaeales archaeon IMC4]